MFAVEWLQSPTIEQLEIIKVVTSNDMNTGSTKTTHLNPQRCSRNANQHDRRFTTHESTSHLRRCARNSNQRTPGGPAFHTPQVPVAASPRKGSKQGKAVGVVQGLKRTLSRQASQGLKRTLSRQASRAGSSSVAGGTSGGSGVGGAATSGKRRKISLAQAHLVPITNLCSRVIVSNTCRSHRQQLIEDGQGKYHHRGRKGNVISEARHIQPRCLVEFV
jgi:hypothetical protein